MNREISPEEARERLNHQRLLDEIKLVVATGPGRAFVKYLFKTLEVGEFPDPGLTGEVLQGMLGIARAGHSIFKLIAQADAMTAGALLAELEKDKYETILRTEANEISGIGDTN